ncbi:MAG: AmmeMemoRadiSam system protein B [Patescibacteria group bacterium]|jgi:aromatic ring-opening dioxygenase LigB subunit|nr:AmmeMemoRadiSam system protein B [Patescibacteria group bacterium]
MSLLVAGLLPHCPLLIPEIGRSNQKFLTKNITAYNQISQEIKDNEVETLVIISPHALDAEGLKINVSPEMIIDFKDFGLISGKDKIKGDSTLADKLYSALKEEIDLKMVSHPLLDYGSAVPSFLLKKDNPNLKIVVISVSKNHDASFHNLVGKTIKQVLKDTPKKTAIVASGDLSHSLKRKSPAGFNPKANKFDNKIIEILSKEESAEENIIKVDFSLAEDVGQCALRPLIVLLGAMSSQFEAKQLAYETEFGIGYLSFIFKPFNKIEEEEEEEEEEENIINDENNLKEIK